jgi:DNA-binding FadR family transcriptional regulator
MLRTKARAPASKTTERRQTLVQSAIESIGRKVLDGTYAEGEVLPPEADLGAELEIGRGTLREAVKGLISKGLLTVAPRRGTSVLPMEQWNLLDPDIIEWSSSESRFLQSLSEFRLAIEPAAAALAAQKLTRLEAAQLLAALEAMANAESGTDDDVVEADLAFHRKILECTHNPFFLNLRHALLGLLRASFTTTVRQKDAYHKSLKLHEELAEAICAKDPARAEAAAKRLIGRHKKDIDTHLKR